MKIMYRKFLSLSITAGIFIPNVVLAEQVIIQQGSSNATAIGNHNHASSSVHQSAVQNQSANSNPYINEQGQVINQQGNSSATATGNNNVVLSNIEQNSIQDQYGNYGYHQPQSGIQHATDNATAEGNNNRIINHTRQYNRQNQWKY